MRSLVLAPLLLLVLATPAVASDGVLEINQTCAEQTGCFAGDTAGFPVMITTPGSYRLTSNLTVPNENTDGIAVSTSDVGIDLNNFAILGPVTCSGSPLTCTPASGTGSGVERILTTNRGISVKNGSITGMGSYGVFLGDQAGVTNMRVRWNRIAGIFAGIGSTLTGNNAYENGQNGITANANSTASGNNVYLNRNNGISMNAGTTVSDNRAYLNGSDGIASGTGSTVRGNSAYQNGGDGIVVSAGSTVSGNSAVDNELDGIRCSIGSMVQGNTVRSNTGFGLNVGSQSGYRENVITSNTAGTVTGSGVNMGDNACNGSLTCP